MDTIFASSPPPTDTERAPRVKSKTKKRSSPRRRRELEQQQQESTDPETSLQEQLQRPAMRQSASMIIDDITGNITHLPESVILNIETSSGSSSSESQIGDDEEDESRDDNIIEEENEEEDEEDDEEGNDDDLQHDNWEIRMLAAELNRRESKREEPLSSETSEADDNLGSTSGRQRLHTRTDTQDTDTDNSELEPERVQRPRAASFDHQSMPRQRPKGILKAFSFDRDKDRL